MCRYKQALRVDGGAPSGVGAFWALRNDERVFPNTQWHALLTVKLAEQVCRAQLPAARTTDLSEKVVSRLFNGTLEATADEHGYLPLRVFLVSESGHEKKAAEYFFTKVTWTRLLKDVNLRGYPVR